MMKHWEKQADRGPTPEQMRLAMIEYAAIEAGRKTRVKSEAQRQAARRRLIRFVSVALNLLFIVICALGVLILCVWSGLPWYITVALVALVIGGSAWLAAKG